jgi:ribosomal protein S18 acetylase RimI-like enzyme
MEISKAEYIDLEQILKLQYLAYQSEAELNNNYRIPPLLQTLEDLQKEYQEGIVLKAVEVDSIIGSVRGYTKADTLYIGKLIVHPDYRRRGIGTKLLLSLEEQYPTMRYELFTGSKSVRNISLYEHLGYIKFKETEVSPKLTLIYLQKNAQ